LIRSVPLPPPQAHPGHLRGAIVAVPVYYGGYYGAGYYDPSTGYAAQPAPAYDATPSPSPVVILNQGIPAPMYRGDGSQPPAPEESTVQPDAPPTIYLIAMTDHTILPAIAYWVENDTLAYITPEGNQNRVSLSLVDREFSKKLNDDRHIEFRLPKQ
jgi:hypothetical protein